MLCYNAMNKEDDGVFKGFTAEADRFLHDIRFNNSQQFYDENRERYEKFVKAPLRLLCDEMAPVVQLIDARLDTRPMRTMSRIRRDTRYTKDQSPFRDHVWLGWRYPGESRSEGFGMWWGFGPDWMSWGCGCYAGDKPLMDALRLQIRRDPDSVRAVLAHPRLKDRFDLYGEAYKKLKVPEDVPEDLRFLYIKKGFGIEHNATKAEWEALRTHGMADILAADLAAMAPLQQLMQRMRANAEHAQAQAVREQEEAQRVPEEAPKPEKLTVRSAEEFEF